jgi:galactokinase
VIPARLAGRLVESGLDPGEARGKTALFDAALTGCASLGHGTPTHAWWVPGRLEVFGKHTDYAGGRTLIAAVPRGFAFVAAGAEGDEVHLLDARTGERLSLGPEQRTLTGWRHYVEVVVSRLARNFPGARRGAAIAFKSDLPRASGMSSSSALVVGVATALARVWNLPVRDEWQRNIRNNAELATYYACLENGLTFGTLAGDPGVGTHGGSEDHAAMLLGRPDHVSAYSFVPMRHLDDARVPDGWRFVIASSGVRAEKTGSARDSYNRLAGASRALLDLWNSEGPHSGSLAGALSRDAAADRLRDLIRRKPVPEWTGEALERRLAHFQMEDGLALEALSAIRQSDATGMGELSEFSQRGAEELLGNQVPETIELVRSARACGAMAACSFGAGFGGSVWALVETERANAFATMWIADYTARYPSAGPVCFAARPGPPLMELAR